MKWTKQKPTRAGHYWYIGPVMSRDLFKASNPKNHPMRCAYPPIIALVGFWFGIEMRVNGHSDLHDKCWSDGDIPVQFMGSTVQRKIKELPDWCMWAGPIVPPFSDRSWSFQPEAHVKHTPATCEINAAEFTAWFDGPQRSRNRPQKGKPPC